MTKNTVELRQFRIDSMISKFFIFILIPLVALLIFKFYNHQAPPEVSFDVLGDEHMENEMLKFRNNTAGDHSYEWNFGDSTEFSQDNSPIHIYSKAGDYTVILVVDGQYEFRELVRVERLKEDIPMTIIPRIAGPKQMFAGVSAIFTCSTKGGNTWEWRVNGSRHVYSKKKSVKYTFSKPGYKTISLVVDGNREFTAQKKIYVRVRATEKHKFITSNNSKVKKEDVYIPETPEVYTILNNIKKESVKEEPLPTDDELTVMFLKIAKGNGDKERFMKYFSDNNKNLMVRCNGNLITFEKLIKDVEGKNIVLKEFSTERRNSTKIINVIIRYKKKRGFKNNLL